MIFSVNIFFQSIKIETITYFLRNYLIKIKIVSSIGVIGIFELSFANPIPILGMVADIPSSHTMVSAQPHF